MKKKCIKRLAVCMILTLFAVQSFMVGARAEEADTVNTSDIVNYNGHAYAIFEEGISWDDAREACEKRGGHLICINNEEEQKFIQTIVAGRSFPYYWIGLTDAETEGAFKWVNGDPLTYTNWGTDQPDNWNNWEDSVMIPNRDMHYSQYEEWSNAFGTWNDINSSGDRDHSLSDMGYICEWDTIDPQRTEILRSTFDALEKALKNEGIEVKIDRDNGTITLDSAILFDRDSYEVKDQGKQEISKFMNALNTVLADEKILEGISSINIQGHTDSDGTYEHNVEVSEKRAEAVRTECMESIKGDTAAAEKFEKLFKTTGCACDFPILDENNVEDKALSRRVVFVFFMK